MGNEKGDCVKLTSKLRVHIERNFLEGTRLFISEEEGNKTIAIAKPLCFEALTQENSGDYFPPTIQFRGSEDDFLQSLVDQAWDIGIRPRYAKETTPEINAIKYHLEDMRSLVFKGKGGAKP